MTTRKLVLLGASVAVLASAVTWRVAGQQAKPTLDELLEGETPVQPLSYAQGIEEGERRAAEALGAMCRLVGVTDGLAHDVALVDNANGTACQGVAEAMNKRWKGESFGCVCP